MQLGYRADHLSFLAVSFPMHRYSDDLTKLLPLGDQVFARLANVPGSCRLARCSFPHSMASRSGASRSFQRARRWRTRRPKRGFQST
jgi:hypothetical protein